MKYNWLDDDGSGATTTHLTGGAQRAASTFCTLVPAANMTRGAQRAASTFMGTYGEPISQPNFSWSSSGPPSHTEAPDNLHKDSSGKPRSSFSIGQLATSPLTRANGPQPYAAAACRAVVDGYPAGFDPNGTEDTAVDSLARKWLTGHESDYGKKSLKCFVFLPQAA